MDMRAITKLPIPDGPYQVGYSHFSFPDDTRMEPSLNAPGRPREIPFMVWYPVDDPGTRPAMKLITQIELACLKRNLIYKLIPGRISAILTNSHVNARLSEQETSFPLLIFSHGFSGYMQQNTLLMEHLASHGFIVASVGHPGDGVASFPDGRALPMDIGSVKKQARDARKIQGVFKKSLKELAKEDLSFEEVRKYTAEFLSTNRMLDQRMEIWVRDILFAADVFEKMNAGSVSSPFEKRLNLEHGIGMLGQSFGGAAAVLASCLDHRLACAINLDGAMFAGMNEKYHYAKPVMYLESDTFPGRSRYFYLINQSDTYHVVIRASRHLDFTDLALLMKTPWLKALGFVGGIRGDRMIDMTNKYVLAFFDRYIRARPAPLLQQPPSPDVFLEKRLIEATRMDVYPMPGPV